MAILGTNLTKITAERKENMQGKVDITNNINIKEVEEKDLGMGKGKQKGLKFSFLFTSSYQPDFASISIDGHVLYIDADKKIDELLDEWKKKKSIDAEVMEQVMNTALTKCNIQAIKISDDMGLPAPLPLPKVQRKE